LSIPLKAGDPVWPAQQDPGNADAGNPFNAGLSMHRESPGTAISVVQDSPEAHLRGRPE